MADVRKMRIYTFDTNGDMVGKWKDVDENFPDGTFRNGTEQNLPHIVVQDANGNILTSFFGDHWNDWGDVENKLTQWQSRYKEKGAGQPGNTNGTGGSGTTETEAQRQARLKAEQDVKDEEKRLKDIIVGEGSLNDLEEALKALIEQNKSYYGRKQNALKLNEGETSAKAYGGRYDVDLNQNGTIEDNEKGYGSIDNTESVMGRSASSAANRLKQSGISDFNTLVENKNQRTEQDINSALMSLMNSNTNTLAELQNSQWGTEAGARTERDEARRKYESALGTTYRRGGYGDWQSGAVPAAGTTAAGNETIESAARTDNLGNLPFDAFMNNYDSSSPTFTIPPRPADTSEYTWKLENNKWIKVYKNNPTATQNISLNNGEGTATF